MNASAALDESSTLVSYDESMAQELERKSALEQLLLLDTLISEIEGRLWKLVRSAVMSDTEADRQLKSVEFSETDGLALRRNLYLGIRNALAHLLSIKERVIHDISPDALGYKVDTRGFPSVEVTNGKPIKLRVDKRILEPFVLDSALHYTAPY
jgi:hypothetical protein